MDFKICIVILYYEIAYLFSLGINTGNVTTGSSSGSFYCTNFFNELLWEYQCNTWSLSRLFWRTTFWKKSPM